MMQIHIVKHDEKLLQIASYYGVSEENLRRVNEITVGEPTEGEELLILIPTRSYRVHQSLHTYRTNKSVQWLKCFSFPQSRDKYRFA